jgi:hypothetical protein
LLFVCFVTRKFIAPGTTSSINKPRFGENEYENYDDNYQEQGEENEGITEPPPKKQRQDTNINTSKFSSMAKRCKVQEICDSTIDDVFAENITDLFRNSINEDQYIELTKDENTARPENCEGLAVILGGFSNLCRYYTRSQTGKSTGYRPTLKPLY